jgi:hypothetical protein
MVTGGHGYQPPVSFIVGKGKDLIECTAGLERAGLLETFALQEQFDTDTVS